MRTYNFDLVYACSIEKINEQLADISDEDPIRVQHFEKDDDFGMDLEIDCELGRWKIVDGGSALILRMEIPINSGMFNFMGKEYDVKTLSVVAAVPIMWIGDGSGRAIKSEGKRTKLMSVIEESTATGGIPGEPGVFYIIDTIDPDGVFGSGAAKTAFESLFVKGIDKVRDQVNHLFAQIDPAPPGSASWMTPKRWTYYYVEGVGGNVSALAVLSVFEDRTLPEAYVDTKIFKPGNEFFMYISQEAFLKNVIMPALPDGFGGSVTPDDFEYVIDTSLLDRQGHVKNKSNRKLYLDGVKVGAIWYNPEINNYKLEADSDEIRVNHDGYCDITGLASSYLTFRGDGKGTAVYDSEDDSMHFTKFDVTCIVEEHIPWWVWLLGLIGGPVVAAIVAAVTVGVTDSIKKAVNGAVNNAGILISPVSVEAVRWLGQDAIPSDGGMEDCIWFVGNLKR